MHPNIPNENGHPLERISSSFLNLQLHLYFFWYSLVVYVCITSMSLHWRHLKIKTILRVGVWEAAKWVAKIRDSSCSSCSSCVILKTDMNGGHFGEGGRHGQCEETAYEYAFLMKAMGISYDPAL